MEGSGHCALCCMQTWMTGHCGRQDLFIHSVQEAGVLTVPEMNFRCVFWENLRDIFHLCSKFICTYAPICMEADTFSLERNSNDWNRTGPYRAPGHKNLSVSRIFLFAGNRLHSASKTFPELQGAGSNSCWSGKGGDAETREEQSRNNSASESFRLCPTTGHIPWENHNSKRVMYQNVHCSSIYNSQDMEAT